MSKQTIYRTLTDSGMTPQGACAMLGNMMAESALRANNAQDGMTSMSDEAYTAAVDNGTYQKFANDAVGYGLCQWTFHTRKTALLYFARNWGKSIGDEQIQTEFCIAELKLDYPALWNFLCETDNLYKATERICKEYERPAINNVDVRYSHAQRFYAELTTTAPTTEELAEIEALNQSATDINVEHKSTTPETVIVKRGSKGKFAKAAQCLLNAHKANGETLLDEDGDIGVLSYTEICSFQAARGLKQDGEIGPDTWAELIKI